MSMHLRFCLAVLIACSVLVVVSLADIKQCTCSPHPWCNIDCDGCAGCRDKTDCAKLMPLVANATAAIRASKFANMTSDLTKFLGRVQVMCTQRGPLHDQAAFALTKHNMTACGSKGVASYSCPICLPCQNVCDGTVTKFQVSNATMWPFGPNQKGRFADSEPWRLVLDMQGPGCYSVLEFSGSESIRMDAMWIWTMMMIAMLVINL